MKKLMFRKPDVILYNVLLILCLSFYSLSGLITVYAEEEQKPCPKPYINSISPKAAAPGDEIKIRGNRFGKTKGSIIFSPDIKAPIVKWTYKRIWVIVPKHAQSGPMYLLSSCGKMSNQAHFTLKVPKK